MTDTFFEVHKNYAENIVVGFARLVEKALALLLINLLFSRCIGY
jgi:acetyl-CoA carboxylase carboxyltransferase component